MDDPIDQERLSASDQDFLDFLDEGGSLETLLDFSTSVKSSDTALSVTFTHDDGTAKDVSLEAIMPLPNLRAPFAEIAAMRTEEIERVTLTLELTKLTKFVEFLTDRRRLGVELGQIDDALLGDFRDWLDEARSPANDGVGNAYAASSRKGEQPLSVDYKREIYRTLMEYLRRLRLQPSYRGHVQSDLNLNTEHTWKKRAKHDPVPVLTREELKLLVRLCREDVIASTLRLRAYWAICDGVATEADREFVDPAVAAEVAGMAAFFGDELPPPCREEVRIVERRAEDGTLTDEFSRRRFPLLWAMKTRQYREAIGLLYPSPAQMLPFCLLFAVYFRYNVGVLGALKRTELQRQPSVYGERLHGTPFKNRAKRKQHASWPITRDVHNPAEMIETLSRWTAGIARHARKEQREHLFLFRDHVRAVHSFASVGALRRNVGMFFRRHAAKDADGKSKFDGKKFAPRSIRPSVIDLVHHLFDGDVIAASHAGHHRHIDTTIEHYLYDGARKRNDEALAPVTGAMQRWVETRGVIDPRGMGASVTLAATPGWECEDVTSGLIAGEEPGLPCRAYGRCVSCELGKTDADSPMAYALAVKLRDSMLRARTTMPEHAWIERWQPELDELERLIALWFTQSAKDKANLNIPDFPTVE